MTDPPAEHCGHQPSIRTTRLTECVLRPGHSGSHADKTGMRWWLADIGQPAPAPADLRERYAAALCSSYCPACGRGDCSPSADQWYEQKQRADRAEAAIERARAECDRLDSARDRLDADCESFGDGYADAAARIRAALNPQEQPDA